MSASHPHTKEMEILTYLVDWGKNKEKAWSGTNYSLLKALSRYYKIVDKDISIKSIILKIIFKYFPRIESMGTGKIVLNRLIYRKNIGKIFQFAEVLETQDHRQTYIYQDLTVDYLYRLAKEDPETFSLSGFQSYSISNIEKRNTLQLKYYKNATAIFTMGKWAAEDLKYHYPHLAHKIYHVGGGINLDVNAIAPSKNKANNKILFIGRDFRRKGGAHVIEVFRILKKDMPNIELHLAGPLINPFSPEDKDCHYYGDADKSTCQKLMNECDVFFMPSYFEAYGLVFIEALTFGLPCIGRKRFEMPYFIEEGITGELIESDSIMESVEKLKLVLSSPKYRVNVLKQRKKYIEEYSWDKVARRMVKYISK